MATSKAKYKITIQFRTPILVWNADLKHELQVYELKFHTVKRYDIERGFVLVHHANGAISLYPLDVVGYLFIEDTQEQEQE